MQTFQNLLLQNCGTEFLDIVKFDNNNILFAKKNQGQTSWPNFHSPPPPHFIRGLLLCGDTQSASGRHLL